MNTLDEVIKAFEECIVPKNVFCKGYYKDDRCKITEDALNYLKQYQRDKQIFSYDVAKKNLELSERNEPLTWEELKLMEGKPLWVEELVQKYSSPHWMIHDGIADAYDGDEILYLQPFETKTKYTLGKTWNAYRKERG